MNQSTEENPQALEDKLMDVMWSLRHVIPQADVKDVQTFVDQHQFRTAFETLVCVLSEDDIAVKSVDLHNLNWLAKIMKLSDAMGMVNHLRVENRA